MQQLDPFGHRDAMGRQLGIHRDLAGNDGSALERFKRALQLDIARLRFARQAQFAWGPCLQCHLAFGNTVAQIDTRFPPVFPALAGQHQVGGRHRAYATVPGHARSPERIKIWLPLVNGLNAPARNSGDVTKVELRHG